MLKETNPEEGRGQEHTRQISIKLCHKDTSGSIRSALPLINLTKLFLIAHRSKTRVTQHGKRLIKGQY